MPRFPLQFQSIDKRTLSSVFSLSVCGLLGVLAVSCKPKQEAVVDPVVVTVGSTTFTASQLQAQIDDLEARGGRLPASLDDYLEVFVERQLAVERALELGLDHEPELRP